MEFDKIKIQIDKYFRSEASIAEENELRAYFASSDVPESLEEYKPIFRHLDIEKEPKFDQEILLKSRNRNWLWLSVMATVVVLLGIGASGYFNFSNPKQDENLGTYDDPKVAFKETQKALALLSENVNVGIKTVHYIQEYETAKEKVFLP